MIFQCIIKMTQPQNSRTTSRRPPENNPGESLCWKLPSDSCSLGAFSRWRRLGRLEQTLATSAIRLDRCDTAVGLRCAPKPATANSGAVCLQRSAPYFAHCLNKPVLAGIIIIIIALFLFIAGCTPRVPPRAAPFLCFSSVFLVRKTFCSIIYARHIRSK